jgi:hypothetical protein
MKYVLAVFAVIAGLYCLHRMALGWERRGWIYYRTRHGSSGGLGSALLEIQAIVEPSKRHVLEERMKDDREPDEAGDPPSPGPTHPH